MFSPVDSDACVRARARAAEPVESVPVLRVCLSDTGSGRFSLTIIIINMTIAAAAAAGGRAPSAAKKSLCQSGECTGVSLMMISLASRGC